MGTLGTTGTTETIGFIRTTGTFGLTRTIETLENSVSPKQTGTKTPGAAWLLKETDWAAQSES